jgi:hypothetical protein
MGKGQDIRQGRLPYITGLAGPKKYGELRPADRARVDLWAETEHAMAKTGAKDIVELQSYFTDKSQNPYGDLELRMREGSGGGADVVKADYEIAKAIQAFSAGYKKPEQPKPTFKQTPMKAEQPSAVTEGPSNVRAAAQNQGYASTLLSTGKKRSAPTRARKASTERTMLTKKDEDTKPKKSKLGSGY